LAIHLQLRGSIIAGQRKPGHAALGQVAPLGDLPLVVDLEQHRNACISLLKAPAMRSISISGRPLSRRRIETLSHPAI
jgi:hypothetical protein